MKRVHGACRALLCTTALHQLVVLHRSDHAVYLETLVATQNK